MVRVKKPKPPRPQMSKEIPNQHLDPGVITGAKDSASRVHLVKSFPAHGSSLYRRWTHNAYRGMVYFKYGQKFKDHQHPQRDMKTNEPIWERPKEIPEEVNKFLREYYATLPKSKP